MAHSVAPTPRGPEKMTENGVSRAIARDAGDGSSEISRGSIDLAVFMTDAAGEVMTIRLRRRHRDRGAIGRKSAVAQPGTMSGGTYVQPRCLRGRDGRIPS